MKREEVYKAIDSERDYQDTIWNEKNTSSKGIHTPEEWIIYLDDYLREAKTLLSRNSIDVAKPQVLHIFRKLAAMLVCAGEQQGMPCRSFQSSGEWEDVVLEYANIHWNDPNILGGPEEITILDKKTAKTAIDFMLWTAGNTGDTWSQSRYKEKVNYLQKVKLMPTDFSNIYQVEKVKQNIEDLNKWYETKYNKS